MSLDDETLPVSALVCLYEVVTAVSIPPISTPVLGAVPLTVTNDTATGRDSDEISSIGNYSAKGDFSRVLRWGLDVGRRCDIRPVIFVPEGARPDASDATLIVRVGILALETKGRITEAVREPIIPPGAG